MAYTARTYTLDGITRSLREWSDFLGIPYERLEARYKLGMSAEKALVNKLLSKKEFPKKKMPEFHIWRSMKARCYNPNHISFKDYGGRGIAVCDEWANSFDNFLKDVGQRPSKDHSIDRIDNNLGYSKENCRWANHETQANNKRNSVKVPFQGKLISINEAMKISGNKRKRIFYLVSKGECILTKLEKRKKYAYKGEFFTIYELTEKLGLSFSCVYQRIAKGKSLDDPHNYKGMKK